ncbi:replication factor C large subunit [Candidatus Pacearchaeota archaeon]|nr:replication factor C large subunit [Candidatus Pacearchaeota archaeon]
MTLSEKYRIKKFSEAVERDKEIAEIKKFLNDFPKKKALILYGPAGTGKTSLSIVSALENNFEILELNASDLRNRQSLEARLKPATEQQALFKKSKIILMDEIDGVTGTTDAGGIQELVRLIVTTKYPIIMTCNDVWQLKFSQLRQKAKLIELKPLSLNAIFSILIKIAEKEGIRSGNDFLKQVAIKSQGDLRAAINDLQSYSANYDIEIDMQEKRDVEESIFNILRKLFKNREPFLDLFDRTNLSLDEIMLWIEENIPKEYKNIALAKAYYALGNADVFRGRIYRNQSWRFLIYQNIFQSAGISLAKTSQHPATFTKYERPRRILKIWMHNQKIEKRKTISKKYARFVHCSTKRILRDFNLLKPIINQEDVQKKLRLSEEEIDFLNKN